MSDQPPPQPPQPYTGYPGNTGGPPGAYQPQTNGMAIASLIFGILGLLILYGIGAVLALVFGYVAKGQIKRSQGMQTGNGLALAGIIMGWIGVVITILFVALVVAGVLFAVNEVGGPEGIREEIESGVADATLQISPEEAGCSVAQQFPDEGQLHVRDDESHPPYRTDPPTSGPHYGIPAQPGFYDAPVAPETLVHNLEHGQIVIWYDPDANDLIKRQIESLVGQEPTATVASPYEGLTGEEPDLVLTAWRASQGCELPSQEAVDDFRRRFQGRAPEPLTPPFTG